MTVEFLHRASDKVSFGQYKGLTFADVFKYTRNYIEWLIKDTEHCFYNLDDFLVSGLPYDLAVDKLTYEQQQTIMSYLQAHTQPSSAGGYRIDKHTAIQLIQQGTITVNDFVKVPYSFSETMSHYNSLKLNRLLVLIKSS